MTNLIITSNLSDDEFQIFYFENIPIRVKPNGADDIICIASDVCTALGLSNIGQAISRLDDDEKGDIILSDVGGRPNRMLYVTEPGLYALINSSRKPQAKAFKRFINHEVLPTLRKSGAYIAKPMTQTEYLVAMAQAMDDLDKRTRALEADNEQHKERFEQLESQTHQIVTENKDLSDQVDYWRDQADINYGTVEQRKRHFPWSR